MSHYSQMNLMRVIQRFLLLFCCGFSLHLDQLGKSGGLPDWLSVGFEQQSAFSFWMGSFARP